MFKTRSKSPLTPAGDLVHLKALVVRQKAQVGEDDEAGEDAAEGVAHHHHQGVLAGGRDVGLFVSLLCICVCVIICVCLYMCLCVYCATMVSFIIRIQ